MPVAHKLRLFWAINLPGQLKTGLASVQERLRTAGADAKWVETENLHLTVKFLGETDPELLTGIIDTAGDRLKNRRPFKLQVKDLGFFPRSGNPRVLWAGLRGETDSLREIAGLIEEAMFVCGFPREGRGFSPHLTLARIKSSLNIDRLTSLIGIQGPKVRELGNFTVSSVELMRSEFTPRGPVYTAIASIRLGIGD